LVKVNLNKEPEAMTEEELKIENELQEKGLTSAPRLTPQAIDDTIVRETYESYTGTTLTVCVLFLKNGFQVVGHSAAVSIENFDPEVGRKIAYDNARNKIWMLEGYLLKQREWEKTNGIVEKE
jgi:hypothetical protein